MERGAVWGGILAAGRGRRIGGPKGGLEWRGRTFLWHQLAGLVNAGIENIAVVLHPQLWELANQYGGEFSEVKILWLEGRPEAEQIDSLRQIWRSIREFRPEGLIAGPVDQGPYPAGLIRELIAAFEEVGRKRIIIPKYRGRPGHPVVLPGPLLPELEGDFDEGLRSLLKKYRAETQFLNLPWPEIVRNINTPADYQKFISSQDRRDG